MARAHEPLAFTCPCRSAEHRGSADVVERVESLEAHELRMEQRDRWECVVWCLDVRWAMSRRWSAGGGGATCAR